MGRHADVSGTKVGGLTWTLYVLREGARLLLGRFALCVVFPLLALWLAPTFLGDGHDMTHADVCASASESGCLQPVQATVGEQTRSFPARWSVGSDTLYFPALGTQPDPGNEVHILVWDNSPVAVADQSGRIIESLDWGWASGWGIWAMILLPIWGALVFLGSLALNRGKRAANVGLVTVILALGAALSGPAAYLGVLLIGGRGLLVGAFLVLAVALIAAGMATKRTGASLRPFPNPPVSG